MRPTNETTYETEAETADGHGARPDFACEGEADPSVEGLHYGRAWHRYRYCYRTSEPLRVLDAGCGTGLSTTWAARLNPGATVLAVDLSAAVVAIARERVEAQGLGARVGFHAHDLSVPLPGDRGRFDFVVCRGVLGRAADPDRLLASLAEALDPEGLLLVTVPSRAGREVARGLRQAVEALAPPGAGSDERLGLARELFHALRPDHPIRTPPGHPPQGASTADADRLLAGYLDDRRDWALDDAAAMLAGAGLRLLYAATPWRWRPDRVFAPDAFPDGLRAGVERLGPDRLSRLVDALDPGLLGDEYQLYACPAAYTPPAPAWPASRRDDPASFDALVPERTGLARTDGDAGWVAQGGRVAYQMVTGTPGELDRMSGLRLAAVDGASSCGVIDGALASRSRAGDDLETRQGQWIDLADAGLIVLKPPGSR